MQDDYYYAVSSGHKSNEIMEVRSLLTIQLPTSVKDGEIM